VIGSTRVAALPGYPFAELPAIKRRLLAAGRDIIDLGAGDNDSPPPPEAVAALRAALDDPALSKYGFQQGHARFRQSVAEYLARRFGHTFDPVTEVLPLIGSKEGLSHLPLTVVDPGDIVIVPEPGYQAYLGGTVLAGAEPVVVPLTADEHFLLEVDRLPPDVLRRAKVLFLNYPNNPTSAVAPPDYLERVVACCRSHGILLAYDNAYCDITFDGYRAPSIFDVAGARETAIEFFSLSKSFSMTGWRLGFAAGRPELIALLARVKSYIDTGPFLAIQEAGAATLDQAERLVAPIVEELTRRRDAAVAALRANGFSVDVPKGAMYLWVGLPSGLPSAAFAKTALEEEGVVVVPGSGFGRAGEGYVRIALTVPSTRLEEAAARLGTTLRRMGTPAVADVLE